MNDPALNGGAGGESAAEHGPSLLVRLSALIRTGRTYDVTNQAFQKQLTDCVAVF